MNRHTIHTLFLTAAVASTGLAPRAGAQLSPFAAAVAIETSITDADYYLFNRRTGLDSTLTYHSTGDASGWSAAMTGTHAGQPVQVAYTGDTSAYLSTSRLTWTQGASIAGESWGGAGSALFTPIDGGYRVDIESNWSVGEDTYGHAGFANSVLDDGELDFTDGEVALTLPPGNPVAAWHYFRETRDDGSIRNGWFKGTVYIVTSGGLRDIFGESYVVDQSVQLVVPSPGSIALLLPALGALALRRRRR